MQLRRDRSYYVEWRERGRRCREKLVGVRSQSAAAKRADTLAGKFADIQPGTADQVTTTLDRLLRSYLAERTPQKGEDKQAHDRRAARVWRDFLGRQRMAARPEELTRREWDGFIHARRTGMIPGCRPVRNRQISMDLKFMVAVLGWGVGTGATREHPWRAEIRRSQGWVMPVERTPHRPAMTDELRAGLTAQAPSWQFSAALVLERETRRRNSAIRRLSWSDVDLAAGTIRWRGEYDKAGRERTTPLTRAAMEVLRSVPRGIGDVPVFPAAADPKQGTPRQTWQVWLRRSKLRWLRSVEDLAERERLREALRGVGFHAEKRAGVRSAAFRALEPREQEELAGTSWKVLRDVYDDLTSADLQDAVRRLDATG